MNQQRIEFDDRLLNKYAVENLEASHPQVHAALTAWFRAFGDFDDTSLEKLAAAKGPAEVGKWKAKGEAALASIPAIAATLDRVIGAVDAALTPANAADHAQLAALRESALRNRIVLTEEAPALVASALGATSGYDDARGSAATAVERAAQKLETMRTRAEDTSLDYFAVQPMVTELKALWRDVDMAVAPLNRADRDAARAPHAAAMATNARALCRSIKEKKTAARESGALPPPTVSATEDRVADHFAVALAKSDFESALALCAPWLRDASSADIVRLVMARPPSEPVGAYSVGSNPMTYENVRDLLGRTLPNDINAENFRGWFRIELLTDEEDTYLTDIDGVDASSIVIVDTGLGERVGFIRLEE